jgi:hypothetical protein
MFFLGGMTMGYLAPPAKAGKVANEASMPAERDRRTIEAPITPQQETAIERSLIWAWRTLC